MADGGRAGAQPTPTTWCSLYNQADQLLDSHISGSHPQQTTVISELTLCPNNPNPGPETAVPQLTATTPE